MVRLVTCDAHDTKQLTANYENVYEGIKSGKIVAAWAALRDS